MSSFDRLVARALRQPAATEAPCPAPETLAAYLDGALTRTERDAVERHASVCPRCAQHLAALVQLEDQLSAGAVPARPSPWRRRWPWLVPAAAAVVAAVVWTAVPNRNLTEVPRTKTMVPPAPAPSADAHAQAQASPAPVFPEPMPAPPVTEHRAAARAPSQSPPPARTSAGPADTVAELNESAPGAPRGRAAGAGASVAAQAVDARESAPRVGAPAPTTMSEVVARPDVLPAPPLPAAPVSAQAPQERGDDAIRKEKGEARAEAPRHAAQEQAAREPATQDLAGSANAASAAPAAAKAVPDATRQRSDFAAAPLVIPSPEPRVRWRVLGAIVERTSDGGRSWRAESAPPVAGPAVGSAPSADVCWLAGADGVVLRRDSTGRWAQVTAPSADRIVRIDARSATAAAVTTAGGQILSTTDGGRTWSKPR